MSDQDSEKTIKLNPKQQRFADEYLIDLNATQAAIRAGYAEASARQQGSRLLTNADIKTYVRTRKAELDAEYEHRIMGKYEVLSRLSEIARGDMGDLQFGSADFLAKAKEAGKSHLIKKVKETTFINGGDDTETHTVELEMYSAHEALRDLGKHHVLFTDKTELSITPEDLAKLTDEQLRRIAEGKQP